MERGLADSERGQIAILKRGVEAIPLVETRLAQAERWLARPPAELLGNIGDPPLSREGRLYPALPGRLLVVHSTLSVVCAMASA
jgi:hypothetical protein